LSFTIYFPHYCTDVKDPLVLDTENAAAWMPSAPRTSTGSQRQNWNTNPQ